MRKSNFTMFLVFASIFLASIATRFVGFATANPFLGYAEGSPPDGASPIITIFSPKNDTPTRSSTFLDFNVSVKSLSAYIQSVYYTASWVDDKISVYKWSHHDLWNSDDDDPYLREFSFSQSLTDIPEGEQKITITAWTNGAYMQSMIAYTFSANSSSSIVFAIDTTPPKVSVINPRDEVYFQSDVPLYFSVNEFVSKISYILDGRENVSIIGNTTLIGLSSGIHNVTVCAWDEAGNAGSSETVTFSVMELESSETFPTVPIAVASGASVVAITAVLVVYIRKRAHKEQENMNKNTLR